MLRRMLIKNYLKEKMGFKFCPEQLCLGRCDTMIMIQVDDMIFPGPVNDVEGVMMPSLKARPV